ncbi:uncharacterized protein LOC132700883, partial [Cylas formicarius]|uniref:uncharacterized protein LOC132700883 n=1 Tax=Cylas formicarius TaxID=197179 RepID=UPI0029584AF9
MQLPFLDVLVIKNSETHMIFDIYRKDTSTLRYITNDSNHAIQHKIRIYEICCNDCGKSYVGQTKRSINVRFKE